MELEDKISAVKSALVLIARAQELERRKWALLQELEEVLARQLREFEGTRSN